MQPLDVVREFVTRINAADAAGLAGLMSPEHRLTDSCGDDILGRDAVVAAWNAYFGMFPDYRIEPETWLENGPTVVVLGHATGTYGVPGQLDPANSWRIPAAWRATVRDGELTEWQVYADNGPVRRIVQRARAASQPRST